MGLAARMQDNEINQTSSQNRLTKEPKMREAIVKKEISYHKDGQEIVVLENMSIWVDVENGIALVGEDHVEIFCDEYHLIN